MAAVNDQTSNENAIDIESGVKTPHSPELAQSEGEIASIERVERVYKYVTLHFPPLLHHPHPMVGPPNRSGLLV